MLLILLILIILILMLLILLLYTNLPPIFHRFRDIAFEMSKIAIFGLCLSPLTEGFSWGDVRKISPACQWVAKVPNGVEAPVMGINYSKSSLTTITFSIT